MAKARNIGRLLGVALAVLPTAKNAQATPATQAPTYDTNTPDAANRPAYTTCYVTSRNDGLPPLKKDIIATAQDILEHDPKGMPGSTLIVDRSAYLLGVSMDETGTLHRVWNTAKLKDDVKAAIKAHNGGSAPSNSELDTTLEKDLIPDLNGNRDLYHSRSVSSLKNMLFGTASGAHGRIVLNSWERVFNVYAREIPIDQRIDMCWTLSHETGHAYDYQDGAAKMPTDSDPAWQRLGKVYDKLAPKQQEDLLALARQDAASKTYLDQAIELARPDRETVLKFIARSYASSKKEEYADAWMLVDQAQQDLEGQLIHQQRETGKIDMAALNLTQFKDRANAFFQHRLDDRFYFVKKHLKYTNHDTARVFPPTLQAIQQMPASTLLGLSPGDAIAAELHGQLDASTSARDARHQQQRALRQQIVSHVVQANGVSFEDYAMTTLQNRAVREKIADHLEAEAVSTPASLLVDAIQEQTIPASQQAEIDTLASQQAELYAEAYQYKQQRGKQPYFDEFEPPYRVHLYNMFDKMDSTGTTYVDEALRQAGSDPVRKEMIYGLKRVVLDWLSRPKNDEIRNERWRDALNTRLLKLDGKENDPTARAALDALDQKVLRHLQAPAQQAKTAGGQGLVPEQATDAAPEGPAEAPHENTFGR